MTLLLDNKGKGKVVDALAKSIKTNARLAIASSLFSIYGYSALKIKLTRIDTYVVHTRNGCRTHCFGRSQFDVKIIVSCDI